MSQPWRSLRPAVCLCLIALLLLAWGLRGGEARASSLLCPREVLPRVSALAQETASPLVVLRLSYALTDLPPQDTLEVSLNLKAAPPGCFSRLVPTETTVAPPPRNPPQVPQRTALIPPFDGLFAQLDSQLRRADLSPLEALDATSPLVFRLGNIASLEAERDFIVSLVSAIVEDLLSQQDPEEPLPEDLTFTLNLERLNVNSQTLLKGQGIFNVDADFNLYLDSLTITISNDTFTSRTRLDPESLSIEQEDFQITLDIGNTTVSSATTFQKDQGVTKQVISLSAWLGPLQLVSQVTLSLDNHEFRLGASIADLAISSVSAVTAEGESIQTFELELQF